MTEVKDRPILYMLIGIPYAGKSTYTRSLHHCRKLSTDDYIERMAEQWKVNYNDAFRIFYREAEQNLEIQLSDAIRNDVDIVWDQTNVSQKSRAKKLAKIPDHYYKIAVFFETPSDEELNRRIAKRSEKIIPEHALLTMKRQLEIPTKEEGFDEIIFHHDIIQGE
ncbi:hypothetical protein [Caulobacter phage Cr30]|uniref:ATPase n=1 Tax=Caulobacter phage Cr30 TaxID=1357714 RepID=UPI0004A9B8B9|nr:ATPase [Caulobacter phage Cr30]AGS80906.1 hypothetical protein [Caulobacter phage Cr30]